MISKVKAFAQIEKIGSDRGRDLNDRMECLNSPLRLPTIMRLDREELRHKETHR